MEKKTNVRIWIEKYIPGFVYVQERQLTADQMEKELLEAIAKDTPPEPRKQEQAVPEGEGNKWTDDLVRQHLIDFGYWVNIGKGRMLGVLRKSMSELLDIYLDSEEYKNKWK